MHQRWENLLFLHWSVSQSDLQPTLPAGLTVDACDGNGYVGLSPFFLRNLRPPWLPPLPGLSNFLELNVRTYVKDASGVPGIWFFSLDCNQPLGVLGARMWLGLPYQLASMRAVQNGETKFTSRRKGSREWARYRYRAAGPALETDPLTLEFFLLERYYLFSKRTHSGPLLRVQVKHQPYQFHEAIVDEWSTLPIQQDGFPSVHSAPVHACVVDGFDVKVFGSENIL